VEVAATPVVATGTADVRGDDAGELLDAPSSIKCLPGQKQQPKMLLKESLPPEPLIIRVQKNLR